MLRSSNALIRNVRASALLRKQFLHDIPSKFEAIAQSRLCLHKFNTHIPSHSRFLHARYAEPTETLEHVSYTSESTRYPPRKSLRNQRLAESQNYNRNLKKRQRREVRGDKQEAEKLMELAKGTGIPTGVSKVAVAKEIDWLKDPKELSTRVARLLQGNQAPMAVAMIRRAETRRLDTSVAWNQLLSYCFDRGAPLAAFRFYNDMKKRARAPTAHTYTIMLKGLCRQSHQTGVKPVELAYRIYRQLLDSDSNVTPTHHHYHAMLEVCGIYHDLETLWNVVGDLPELGPHKPTAQTYTIILQAILDALPNQIKEIPEDQMELRTKKHDALVLDAKRVWADVINQWRKGELALDAELVSVMAWVLIDPLDELNCYNALALYKQTSNIPILVPKPQASSSKSSRQGEWEAAVRLSKKREDHDDKFNYTSWRSLDSESEDVAKLDEATTADDADDKTKLVENLEDVFDPIDEINGEGEPQFLAPDNRVLHIILTVCRILTKGTAAGRGYWNLFTIDREGYNITPDPGNFYAYLRLLRISRSSQTALDVIRQQLLPTGKLDGKALHIAMSCCLRDRTNPNVLRIAQQMLSLMREQLPLPDPRPLTDFLALADALTANPQWLLVLRGLEDIDPNTTNLTLMGRNMRWALQKAVITSLEPHADRLYESMERVLDSPVQFYSTSSAQSLESVNGYLALQFMVKFRELLDKALGTQFADVMTQADRDRILPLAIKLRKFSKPEIAQKIEKSVLRPLAHHYSFD